MSKEMTPTQRLAGYICVFLDKNLSEDTSRIIKVNLITQILEYRKQEIQEFCNRKNICFDCGDKLDENHKEECWDNNEPKRTNTDDSE